ncbi:Hypothetical_protein [Hexamita inflata]|uniref:Hypothetical_protein n=1 Tax=Hexamita inflata TaxID=28002 RepID=A0AA86QA49_9EUKA|nr:Hypothetical protein HINF_LOCUS10590 [Hexamita inflata]CAI9951618.1 Hypothetical protein HINF_LOCUS39263 [Hexamita inflata]
MYNLLHKCRFRNGKFQLQLSAPVTPSSFKLSLFQHTSISFSSLFKNISQSNTSQIQVHELLQSSHIWPCGCYLWYFAFNLVNKQVFSFGPNQSQVFIQFKAIFNDSEYIGHIIVPVLNKLEITNFTQFLKNRTEKTQFGVELSSQLESTAWFPNQNVHISISLYSLEPLKQVKLKINRYVVLKTKSKRKQLKHTVFETLLYTEVEKLKLVEIDSVVQVAQLGLALGSVRDELIDVSYKLKIVAAVGTKQVKCVTDIVVMPIDIQDRAPMTGLAECYALIVSHTETK